MDFNDIKQSIDYFEKVDKSALPLAISTLAALISFASVVFTSWSFRKQTETSKYSYLASIWHDVLDASIEMPALTNKAVTSRYFSTLKDDDLRKYHVFCYKAWGHVEDIVAARFSENEQFEPIIKWVAAYHYAWLERNPTFFTLPAFWRKVDEMRNEPTLVFGYQALPSIDGGIDWDLIAPRYDEYILSPFAFEMTKAEVGTDPRNLLLPFLAHIPKDDISTMEIADFGCGPGNLIPFLAGLGCKLTGFDRSEKAIKIASDKAKKFGVQFFGVVTDFSHISNDKRFDLIISVNAILPDERLEVVSIFKKIRDCLKPGGKAVMILPSFDTTEHLLDLWIKFYAKAYPKDEHHPERIAKAFRATKKMDLEQSRYADDGKHAQCYHTPKTIDAELQQAGLRLVQRPKKILYPWELTKRFDYGYFPDEKEEIWDWFVIAERSI